MNSNARTVSDIPVIGWAWILVDERTGQDYDRGFSWGETRPNMPARAGTHYDYRALVTRYKALEATGEINARVRTSWNILHGPDSDAVVDVVDGDEQASSLVPEVPIRGAGIPRHEGLTIPTGDDFADKAERMLSELVDKIMPELDTGDLLADAATASRSLDAAPTGEQAGEVVTLAEAERVAHHAYVAGKRRYTFTGFVVELRAASRAQPRTVRVPDGWKLAPAKATKEMVRAGCDLGIATFEEIYGAMLAATPAPAKAGEA